MSTAIVKNTQVINDGACIKIEREGKTLILVKEQVRLIDLVRDSIIRIDIGEGPLNNIFINHADVFAPQTATAVELMELVKAMVSATNENAEVAKEITQLQVMSYLQEIKNQNYIFFRNLLQPTIQKMEPTYVDESDANKIYRGWTMTNADPSKPSWVIERISKNKGIVIREWADGNQQMDNIWNNRTSLVYAPYIQFPEGPDS